MAAIITSLISFEKIWLRVVSAVTGNPPFSVYNWQVASCEYEQYCDVVLRREKGKSV